MTQGKSILVIEDDRTFATALQDSLAAQGYAVRVVHTGEEGLVQAQQQKPDLIILDLMLDKVTGIKILQELRKDVVWGKTVPIIVVSSVAYLQNMAEVKDLATKLIPKNDFEMPKFIDYVKQALS